jgi:hypothetical protein
VKPMKELTPQVKLDVLQEALEVLR